MKTFDEPSFIALVENSWGIQEAGFKAVSKYDVENLVSAIRHNLLKYGNERHTEEFVLRELYRPFNGQTLGIEEIQGMLNKINLAADPRYLQALINSLDVQNCGTIEFEDFRAAIIENRYNKF